MTSYVWPYPRPGIDIAYAAITLPTSPSGGGWWSAQVVENGALVLIGSDVSGYFLTAVLAAPGGTWVVSPALDTGAAFFDYVCYGNGYYVASNRTGSNSGREYVHTADPSGAWTLGTIASVSGAPSGIGFGNGYFVCAASNGNWSARVANPSTAWTTQTGLSQGLRYAPPKWVGTKYIQPTSGFFNDGACFSTDGLTWTGTATNGSFQLCRSIELLSGARVITEAGRVYDLNMVLEHTFISSAHTLATDYDQFLASFNPVFVDISFDQGVTRTSVEITYMIDAAVPTSPYNNAAAGVWDDFPVAIFDHPTTGQVVPTTLDVSNIPAPPLYALNNNDEVTAVLGRENYQNTFAVTVPPGAASVSIAVSFGPGAAGYADFYQLDSGTFDYDGDYLGWIDANDQPTTTLDIIPNGATTIYFGMDPYTDGDGANITDMTITAAAQFFWTDFINSEAT